MHTDPEQHAPGAANFIGSCASVTYCALQQYELYSTLLWSHSNATSQPVTLLLVQGL